jgi:hypothetical protein
MQPAAQASFGIGVFGAVAVAGRSARLSRVGARSTLQFTKTR